MVRFRRPADPNWIRRPAVYGSTGRVEPGKAEFRDRETGQRSALAIGKNYSYEIRVEDGRTTYKPAGRNGVDAEALRLRIAAKSSLAHSARRPASSSSTLPRRKRNGRASRTPSTTTSKTH